MKHTKLIRRCVMLGAAISMMATLLLYISSSAADESLTVQPDDIESSPFYKPSFEVDPKALGSTQDAISDCLKLNHSSFQCVGSTIETCGEDYKRCALIEVSAWQAILSEYLVILRQSGASQEQLAKSQAAWETYLQEECSFVRSLWLSDPAMRVGETIQCQLNHIAFRTIEVRTHAIDLK